MIEATAFGAASWGGRGVEEGLRDRLVESLVAEDASARPQGFLMWRRLGDEAEILTLAVAPGQQRRGCAGALLDAVIDALRRDGVRSLFLEVDAGNAGAISLYEAHKFCRIARRKRYYRSGADALVMRADL
jgi:ribosomal-protein-alanine N-acetyltransferase